MRPFTDISLRTAALALTLLAATSQCVTDHDALAKRDRGGEGGGGGGGRGGGAGTGGQPDPSGGSTGKYTEPRGRSVVTFLHGVVDATKVAFCFAREEKGKLKLVGEPMPPGGLQFARAFHAELLPELSFADDTITPYVIGGDLELIDGLDCKAAVALAEELMEEALPEPGNGGAPGGTGGAPGGEGGASSGQGGALGGEGGASSGQGGAPHAEGGAPNGVGGEPAVALDGVGGEGGAPPIALPDPPALRVRALPALPAGTLSSGLSYLLVAEGCLGGPWFIDKSYEEICGVGIAGDTTLSPSFVVMSRETGVTIGFQALNASRASGPLDAVVSPPRDGVTLPIVIASKVVHGRVAPVPANILYSRYEYGIDDPTYRVRFIDSRGRETSASWDELFERARLDDLEERQNYVLVAVGPRVGFGREGWWNPPSIALVAAEP